MVPDLGDAAHGQPAAPVPPPGPGAEAFSLRKFARGLNPFNEVLWAKAFTLGLRLALALGLFILVKTYVGRPRVGQAVQIVNPSGPVTIHSPERRGLVLTVQARSQAIGVTLGSRFGERFSYGIGGEYDFEDDQLRPLIIGSLWF